MNYELKKISDSSGDRYPFKVSDEYFDHLTARIMEQIPEEEAPRTAEPQRIKLNHRHKRMWSYITSIAAGLALVAVVALKLVPLPDSTSRYLTSTSAIWPSSADGYAQLNTSEYTYEDYNEDLMTYSMADNMDVYNYLSGNTDY